MGFKEIEKFNDALLSKQVWQLINNPTSLCYRVFKARFFPDCSILEARESVVGSYAWKSLLSARDDLASREWGVCANKRGPLAAKPSLLLCYFSLAAGG